MQPSEPVLASDKLHTRSRRRDHISKMMSNVGIALQEYILAFACSLDPSERSSRFGVAVMVLAGLTAFVMALLAMVTLHMDTLEASRISVACYYHILYIRSLARSLA